MAIGNIRAGYMGVLDIGGGSIRFTSGSIYARQEVNAPDLIMGTWNRNAAVMGPIEITGNFSGPVTENFGAIWTAAFARDSCGQVAVSPVAIRYFCDDAGRSFQAMINSLTFSCSAGDVAQFSIDFVGAEEPVAGALADNVTEEKLVTWDEVSVTGGTPYISNDKISNFEVTINNNVEAVYAIASTANYYPFDLIAGLRSISYELQTGGEAINYGDANNSPADKQLVSFNNGSETIGVNVLFHRFEPVAATGPFVSTVGFTGVGTQPGE